MDNVMEGIKRLVTEENEFESRVKPKTTQFFFLLDLLESDAGNNFKNCSIN